MHGAAAAQSANIILRCVPRPLVRNGVQGCPGMIQKHQAAANAQAGNRGVSPTNAKAGQLSQKLAMERRTSSSANVKGNPNERMMVS